MGCREGVLTGGKPGQTFSHFRQVFGLWEEMRCGCADCYSLLVSSPDEHDFNRNENLLANGGCSLSAEILKWI